MDHGILVIDDEQVFLDTIKRGLVSCGFRNVHLESDPDKAATLFGNGESFDLALIDLNMPGTSGIELLKQIKDRSPSTECLMVTATNEARVAVDCLKNGAYDYLVKPVSRDDLVLAVSRAMERKRLLDIPAPGKGMDLPRLAHPEAFEPIVTRSKKMFNILREAELHAASDVPMLISGESGTGKELLARAIHRASPRARFPFTPINMASLSANLFESEFFGHTKGAFTGAQKDRVGYIEQTARGTLFLDEIGTLPLELQGKLLRVLQEGEYLKLGSSRTQKADVRFIAATNEDLERLMHKGTFRKDLYYRLKGAWLHLPALRERRDDIAFLAERFLMAFRGSSKHPGIEEDAMSMLLDYSYPGNIRELKSILQSAVNLAQRRPISPRFLPSYVRSRRPMLKRDVQEQCSQIAPLEDIEKAHILRAYQKTGANKAQTAKLLAIGLNTLRRKLASYGVG